jgi:hypothetical protein
LDDYVAVNRFQQVVAVAVMGVLFISGCGQPPSSLDSAPTSTSPVASDFCPEVVELLDDFNAIAIDGFLNDDSKTLEDMAFNAKKISGLVGRAENQGVDLAAPDSVWFRSLRDSANSFLALVQADPETFSDSEFRTRLERIIGWYEVASSECRSVVA